MYTRDRAEWIKNRLQVIQGDINRLEKERSALIMERVKLGVETMRIDAPVVNIVIVADGKVAGVLSGYPIDDAIKELHLRANYIQMQHSDVWFEDKQMVYKTGNQRMFLEEYKP